MSSKINQKVDGKIFFTHILIISSIYILYLAEVFRPDSLANELFEILKFTELYISI